MRTCAFVALMVVAAVFVVASLYFPPVTRAACFECDASGTCPGFPVPSGCVMKGKCKDTSFTESCCTDICITSISHCFCNTEDKSHTCAGYDSCQECFFERTERCTACN